MAKQDNTERNAAIVAALASGTKAAAVAEQFGVSVSTVRKVAATAGQPKTKADVVEAIENALAGSVAEANAALEPTEPETAEGIETAEEATKLPVADARTKLTLKKVLAWNAKWNDDDRAAIGAAIEEVGGTKFLLPPSEAYIRIETADGSNPLEVSTSRIRYRGEGAEAHGEKDSTGWVNVGLSTSRAKASA